jgi:hypothetical protein
MVVCLRAVSHEALWQVAIHISANNAMSFHAIRDQLSKRGVVKLFVKRLASNDDSRNQVYVSPDEHILSQIPALNIERKVEAGKSTKKRVVGGVSFYAHLDLNWMDESGSIYAAPHAKLIYYPQYPEVRLSGFLKGCKKSPSAIMNDRTEGRILLIGATKSKRLIAMVFAAESSIAKEIAAEFGLSVEKDGKSPIRSVEMLRAGDVDDHRSKLIADLKEICEGGLARGRRLTNSGELDYKAPNAGGFTLEALLGICSNASANPDYLGWEIKSHSSKGKSKLTLFSSQPDAGHYLEMGHVKWMRKYGYPDKKGRKHRLNYGGAYRMDHRVDATSHTLLVDDWLSVSANAGVHLVDDNGDAVATWTHEKLMEHWTKKHAQAAYVEYTREDVGGHPYFAYQQVVGLGQSTSYAHFIAAIKSGSLLLDPGCNLKRVNSDKPVSKARFQFRTSVKSLRQLYVSYEHVDVMVA